MSSGKHVEEFRWFEMHIEGPDLFRKMKRKLLQCVIAKTDGHMLAMVCILGVGEGAIRKWIDDLELREELEAARREGQIGKKAADDRKGREADAG